MSYEMGAAGPRKKSREGLIWGAKRTSKPGKTQRQAALELLSGSGRAVSALGVGGVGQVGAELHPASP